MSAIRNERLFRASLVAALAPIVVATARAAHRGWLPVGDNANFLIRSRDVFTEHHPLLGTWTSASVSAGADFNNPGPLFFDLLAIPAKLGGATGLAIGVALLNGLAVIGTGIMARRRGGPLVGTAALLTCALLGASLGSELLFDPWQPHSLLLPFLFGLVCVWSLADGDLAALPWGLATGSLIIQTHLSYAVLIPAVGGWGLLGLALVLRRQRADDPDGWPARRRAVAKAVAVSALVLALCWIQPLIEAVTAGDQGNLGLLARDASTSEEAVGVGLGTRIVADTVAVPPFWLRPSFEDSLRGGEGRTRDPSSVDPSAPVAAGLLVVVAGLLGGAGWDARRRRDRVVGTAVVTAGVALAAALATAWRLPFGTFGVAAHQFRWLWPVAAFATLALLTTVLRRAAGTEARTRRLVVALAVLTVLVAVASLPTYNVRSGPAADSEVIATIHEANRQMAVLEGQGPFLIDLSGIRFAEPYTAPAMAELQRRGIPFLVEDEGMVRQMGEGRRWEEGDEVQRLLFREGDAARDGIPGTRRIVYVEGLAPDEQRERDELRAAIVDHLADAGLPTRDLDGSGLSPAQRDALTAEDLDGEAVADALGAGVLLHLIDRDLLVVDDVWAERLERYAELEHRWAARTMAIFLAPPDGPEA